MQYYLEPLNEVLNFIQAPTGGNSYFPGGIPFTDYNFVGLSGGGWTCTVYGALDPRIRNMVCIAGSNPGYWYADPSFVSNADQEQSTPTFYSIAGYLDLYIMASSGVGRLHRQILNNNDNCCFGVTQWTNWSGFNLQTYYSVGGNGAAQCGNKATCAWSDYWNYYSGQLTANQPNVAPANNLPVVADPQSTGHQISVCSSATGGNAAYHGTTACSQGATGGPGGKLDALTLAIATLDGNPFVAPPAVMAGGTRGLRMGGR
jgi:hypothetical protein